MGTFFVILGGLGVALVLMTRWHDQPGWRKTVAIVGGVGSLISIVGSCYSRRTSELAMKSTITALETKAAQRNISGWSRERAIAILRAHPRRIAIGSSYFGEEPKNYATPLIEMFREAGWDTSICVVQYTNPPRWKSPATPIARRRP